VTSPEAIFDRDSSLFVARGLYILRYQFGAADSEHPVAAAVPVPGFEDVIQVISEPGSAEGQLERPGSVALVRAADNGKLRIGVRRRSSNGSLDAAFKLESVGISSDNKLAAVGASAIALRAPSPSQSAVARNPSGSDDALFLAHVSRRGDVSVKPNEWAGGPDAPGRIEGLELQRHNKEGFQVEAQVLSGGRNSTWSEWFGAGVFGGTRGRNQPLLGVRLRLIGEQARHFFVHAEAVFLGSAIVSQRGREVECASQTRRDPLVGFRFEICAERRVNIRPAAGHDEQPRVRIFRAKAG
jgi:hypothetical protein